MPPKTPTTPKGGGKGRGRARISVVKVAAGAKTPLTSSGSTDTKESDETNVGTVDAATEEQRGKFKGFSRAAHSIMSMHKLQVPTTSTENVTQLPTARKDPWAAVVKSVATKASRNGEVGLGLGVSSGATSDKRISLAQMLKSREMKNLVQQALVAKQVPEEQSSVMSHWIKISTLRRRQNETHEELAAGGDAGSRPDNSNNYEDEEESETWEDADGVHSGFDLDDTVKGHHLYGRTLILEESCRRALAQDGEQRSQMDLQSLGVWFQTTKLKISTDFERLQPSELDLLCRRMTCVSFHPDETIFRQGDEGDALYIVFSGTVEVRVSQRILGEVVEVTVCELGKGDYFGERSLLNNDVRAATVLSKTAAELVKITRNDYNLMLKNDQLEFLSRMQIANGIGVQRPVQRTQREYIKVLTKKKHARTKADIDMLSEYLQTLKFFRSLPKNFIRELCVVVDFLTLPAGACVFREGEVGDLFYIIFSGSVDVNINSKDFKGNMQMTKLVNLTEGSHFGELALMKGRGVRSATVITREECQLLLICEKDYNSTLRRMQKKDMAKRVGVLDQIPMFQTPEWTGELLKELSYVLLEQKLSTGSTLYKQGERATHVYFVVRGEFVVTKEITDPFTQVKHEVFVERIGRFRVVGDDAAAGMNFNEVIHREVTVNASTPVEVLLLSKYDVFHRLSRSARETLRAAAQSHAESIVYLDRFHKTQKWEAYKQKILREHVNHERIEKILPSATTAMQIANKNTNTGANMKTSQSRQSTAVRIESQSSSSSPTKPGSGRGSQSPTTTEGVTLPALPLPRSSGNGKTLDSSRSSGSRSARQVLVPANELLLLAKEAKAVKKCFNPDQTLGKYVTSFNVDAPPSSARQGQLDGVLAAEERRQAEVLNEGNPLAFFDVKVVDKQVGASWNRTEKSLEEVEQCDNNQSNGGLMTPESPRTSSVSPLHRTSPSVRNSSRSLNITSQALSQLLQENFTFSRPAGSKPEGEDGRCTRPQHKGVSFKDAIREISTSPTRGGSPSRFNVERIQTDSSGETDYVLFGFLNETSDDRSEATKKSPAFQILQSTRSLFAAREAVERVQEDDRIKYYTLSFKTFALVPRADRSKVDEDRLQVQQFGEIGSHRMKSPTSPSIEESTSSLLSMTSNSAVHFASFQEVASSLAMTDKIERRPTVLGSSVDSSNQAPSSPARVANQVTFGTPRRQTFNSAAAVRNTFAVASVVLSKLEVAKSQYDEPFVAVHALLSSEMEAVTHAMTLRPAQILKSAMLCVFPMGKWIHLEHAHNWCVQVEANKREKRAPSLTSPSSSPNARSRRLSLVPEPPRPIWQLERDEAKRLHNFVCARMGAPVLDKKKDRTEESGGFTPQPLVSLEDKLDTLHNYLQSNAAFTARTGHGGVALLKYRQVKRFGSIMRLRIAGALPHNNNNSSGGNNSSNNSPSPRASFSTVVPG